MGDPPTIPNEKLPIKWNRKKVWIKFLASYFLKSIAAIAKLNPWEVLSAYSNKSLNKNPTD